MTKLLQVCLIVTGITLMLAVWKFWLAPRELAPANSMSPTVQAATISLEPAKSVDEIGEIAGYDFSEKKKNVQVVELPKSLKEVSGMALTNDGRLLCHNDENGTVFEIDPIKNIEVKRFYVGKPLVLGDFEGIAAKGDTLFLVESSGNLFRFFEGESGTHVRYDYFKTPLTSKNNVEGLAYDPETDCLLLACKGDPGKGFDDYKAVYSFSLKTYQLAPQPRFLLPLKIILKQTGENEFNPSAIERHPVTGNFYVMAFNGHAIVEVDRTGGLLGVSTLKKSVNAQPEGLAISENGTVYIGNEGRKKVAKLTVYPPVGSGE